MALPIFVNLVNSFILHRSSIHERGNLDQAKMGPRFGNTIPHLLSRPKDFASLELFTRGVRHSSRFGTRKRQVCPKRRNLALCGVRARTRDL